MTIKTSKMLNLSLKYCFKPKASSLIIISKENKVVKIKFA